MTELIKTPTDIFYDKLRTLSRKELLNIIEEQTPYYIEQIKKIEYVFRRKLKHIRWEDGTPVTERDLTNEELIKLIDPPFIYSREYAKMGFNEEMQRQIHIASDPIT